MSSSVGTPLWSTNHPENCIPAFASQNITIKIINIFAAKLKLLTHLSFSYAKFLISNLLVDFFNFICLFASSFFYTIEIKLKINLNQKVLSLQGKNM